ncbi:MAG: hypothetical protein HN987_05010 [Proteobacteria bacterium]|nr:hypothetical protein [Pseudomonadota bacterium]
MKILTMLTVGLPRLSAFAVSGVTLFGMIFFADLAEGNEPTVFSLTQQDWEIVFHSERRESYPGEAPYEAPYEALERVVLVTEYHLEKAGQKMVCFLSYDSQKDRQSETCAVQ